jgi:hypothetical protein
MPVENSRDPRETLVRDKYFSMRPKPLERWLWTQRLSSSAERVFWYHWDEGQKSGTWCSQVPIMAVARECSLDTATVSRAYQALRRLGLIARQDPGRDDTNPFRQATAVTEVFVPREVTKQLAAHPNRRRGEGNVVPMRPTAPAAANTRPAAPGPASAPVAIGLSWRESQAIFKKLSAAERQMFYVEQRARTTRIVFDADTRLTPEEQAHVRQTVELLGTAAPARSEPASPAKIRASTLSRRLSVLEVARIRRLVQAAAARSGRGDLPGLLREIVWSVERGTLSRFAPDHAVHIACKKVREGAWATPYRMPPDWTLPGAVPEYRSAAGV